MSILEKMFVFDFFGTIILKTEKKENVMCYPTYNNLSNVPKTLLFLQNVVF